MKILDVPRASGEQSRDAIDEMLEEIQGLVDEFNEPLPFASEWAAMNRLRLDLEDSLKKIEASLGLWEVTRNGVRVTSIEVPAGYPPQRAEELAKSSLAKLRAEDEAKSAEWSYGPVEFYLDGDDDGPEDC